MKTQEELKALKEEYRTLKTKLQELTDEELKQVTGGFEFPVPGFDIPGGEKQYDIHIYGTSDPGKTDFLHN